MKTTKHCMVGIEDISELCDSCSHIAKKYKVKVDIAQHSKLVNGCSLQSLFALDFTEPVWVVMRGNVGAEDLKIFERWELKNV